MDAGLREGEAEAVRPHAAHVRSAHVGGAHVGPHVGRHACGGQSGAHALLAGPGGEARGRGVGGAHATRAELARRHRSGIAKNKLLVISLSQKWLGTRL